MKNVIKLILLINLLSIQLLFANSVSEEALDKATLYYEKQNYQEALKWLKISYNEEPSKEAAFNFGLVYQELKEFNTAIKWYEISYSTGNIESGTNLGYIYKNVNKDYRKSIEWYKKAADQGVTTSIYNLALLYQEMDDLPKAIQCYQKGVQLKDYDSIKNLGNLYYKENKKTKGAAYMLGLLSIKPEKKEKLINYLKTKWGLSDKELKEAYKLQLTLIPDPYRDSEFEEETKKRKSGRR